jgi:hypothetical protein
MWKLLLKAVHYSYQPLGQQKLLDLLNKKDHLNLWEVVLQNVPKYLRRHRPSLRPNQDSEEVFVHPTSEKIKIRYL